MLWVLIEVPLRGTSNEYPQHMFFCREIRKILCEYSLLSAAMNYPYLIAALQFDLTSQGTFSFGKIIVVSPSKWLAVWEKGIYGIWKQC